MSAKPKTNTKISTNTHNNNNNNNNKSPGGSRSILSPAHTNPSINSDSSVLLLISTLFWTARIIVFLQMGNFFCASSNSSVPANSEGRNLASLLSLVQKTTKCKQGPLPWRPSGRHVCTRVYIRDWTKIHTHTYTCVYIYKTGQGNLTPNNGKFVYPNEG
jgi:hypothetical protein